MSRLTHLVEQRIAEAQAAGLLQGLEGEGKPLPERPVQDAEAEALSTGYRIMAQAGAVPEEVTLKKQLQEARRAYATLTDAEAAKAQMALIAGLELRLNIATEARKAFMR